MINSKICAPIAILGFWVIKYCIIDRSISSTEKELGNIFWDAEMIFPVNSHFFE
jgi:hypothetical protein